MILNVLIVPHILPTAPPETAVVVGVVDIIRQLISSLPPLQARILITLTILASRFALLYQARYFWFFIIIKFPRIYEFN